MPHRPPWLTAAVVFPRALGSPPSPKPRTLIRRADRSCSNVTPCDGGAPLGRVRRDGPGARPYGRPAAPAAWFTAAVVPARSWVAVKRGPRLRAAAAARERDAKRLVGADELEALDQRRPALFPLAARWSRAAHGGLLLLWWTRCTGTLAEHARARRRGGAQRVCALARRTGRPDARPSRELDAVRARARTRLHACACASRRARGRPHCGPRSAALVAGPLPLPRFRARFRARSVTPRRPPGASRRAAAAGTTKLAATRPSPSLRSSSSTSCRQ